MTDKIIEQMSKDIAPKNMDEFYMGLMLQGILSMMALEDEEFDPELFDDLLESGRESLEYWMVKYKYEYETIVGEKRKGTHIR